MRASPPACLDLGQLLLQRLGYFGGVFAWRHVADGRLQVAQHLDHAGVVLAMEGIQLVEDVMAALDAGMVKDLPAGHDLVGDAAEAQSDFDACVAAGRLP